MGTRMHISRRRAIVAGLGATAAVVATVAGLQTISKKSDYRNDYDVVAVVAYYETPNIAETGYFSAKYRVSDCGADWWPWQYDNDNWNGQDGYAGDMVPIDRFYIELSR